MKGFLKAIGPNLDRPILQNPSWNSLDGTEFYHAGIEGLEHGYNGSFEELPKVGERFRFVAENNGPNVDTSLVMKERPKFVDNYTIVFETYYSIYELEMACEL